MKWSDISSSIGKFAPMLGGALGGPAGAVAGSALAKFLGVEDNPHEVIKHIENNPESYVKIRDFEIEYFKLQADLNKTMLNNESKSNHTTRPKIAYQAFQVVAAIALMIVFGWLYAVVSNDYELVKEIVNGWPFVVGVITPFVAWLNAYFGVLRKEQADRMNAFNGNPITGLFDLFRSKK